MISLENVSKRYHGDASAAVRGIDLEVAENTLLVLLGESGCGKTTTLKMINRLVEATTGTIRVAGADLRQSDPVSLRRRIGYVFQGLGLFPHLTVAENIATVPRLLGWSAADIRARVGELLEMVEMPGTEFPGRYPRELSGGQRQRVGVARALAARPRILLMDEPFGSLDPLTRGELQRQLKTLQRVEQLTVVLVTHDMTEALLLADVIAVMKNGRILGRGTPAQLLSNPPHPYIKILMELPRRQADVVARLAHPAS